MTLHSDIVAAKTTMSQIRDLESNYQVKTVLAHDVSWMRQGDDAVLLSLLDDYLLGAKDRISRDEIP